MSICPYFVFLADRTAIQYDRLWQNPVVRLFVCDAVRCGSQGWYTGLKVVPASSSQQSPICPLRHFWCRVYHLATKRTGKKRVEDKANVSFLRHRKPLVRWFK